MIAVLFSAVLVRGYAVLLRLAEECCSGVDFRLFDCALGVHGGGFRLDRGAFYYGLDSIFCWVCWRVCVVVVSAIFGGRGRHVRLSQTGWVRGTVLVLA